MSNKVMVYLGAGVGGVIGGFVPALWHAGWLSMWGVLFEAIGGLAGIWAALKLINV